jgi:hypothetical protein
MPTQKPLKLWHITRKNPGGYDTYQDAVVAAYTARDARYTHPNEMVIGWDGTAAQRYDSWVPVEEVHAKCIGIANKGIKPGIIVASYNAG